MSALLKGGVLVCGISKVLAADAAGTFPVLDCYSSDALKKTKKTCVRNRKNCVCVCTWVCTCVCVFVRERD